jgi:hypothetical protein
VFDVFEVDKLRRKICSVDQPGGDCLKSWSNLKSVPKENEPPNITKLCTMLPTGRLRV